jgi:hypothetical protein
MTRPPQPPWWWQSDVLERMAIGLAAAVLAAMVVFGGEGYIFSVGQLPKPIPAKSPAPAKLKAVIPPAPPENTLLMPEPPTPVPLPDGSITHPVLRGPVDCSWYGWVVPCAGQWPKITHY